MSNGESGGTSGERGTSPHDLAAAMTPTQAASLLSLMDRLSRAVSISDTATVIVEGGAAALGADGDLQLWVWDDEGLYLELLRSRYPVDEQRQGVRLLGSEDLPVTYAARMGEPLWFGSRDDYLRAYVGAADAHSRGAEAAAVLPLSTRERTFGALTLRWTAKRTPSDDERTYAMTLCRIFAQALDRGWLAHEQSIARERAESNERRSRLLAEASALLTMSLVEDEIYRRAAEIAVPAFADWCLVDVRDASDRFQRVLLHRRDRTAPDLGEQLEEAMPPSDDGPSWLHRAVRDVESQLVTNASLPAPGEAAVDSARLALLEEIGVRSFIIVPLVVRGRVEGVLSFLRGQGAAAYLPDDVTLAEDLTHRAALAIENARLFHTERRHAQDVYRLQRISEGLTVAVTPDDVADVVVAHGLPAVGAVAGVLVLHDERHGAFGLTGERGEAPGAWRKLPLSPPTPLGDAILHGEPVFLESAERWAREYPCAAANPLAAPGARVTLPLRAGDKVLGALGYAFPGPRRFSQDDKELLIAIARQCSLALERARLYAEQAKAREQTLMLLRVTSALALARTTDEVVRTVVEEVIPVVGGEVGYLGLLAPDSDTINVYVSEREGRAHPALPARIDAAARNPLSDVVRTGRALCFETTSAYREAYAAVEQPADATARDAFEASAVLAINAAGRTVGALGVRFDQQRDRPYFFDEDTVQLLEAVAIQCGDALERAELLEREGEARRGAEVANRAKDEFLAMLGHELRNPLMPIVTALSLMRIKGDEHFVKERAMIQRQAQHLLRLVDDLLDVSRIARGKIDLRRRRTDLAEVVRHAMETTSPLFEQRQHHVDVVLEDGLIIDGDESRLVQVFANLLSNAAKYTDAGGRVSVHGRVEGDEVVVRVTDSGVGIDPHLRARIFDLFVQGARGIDRAQGGLGLGLALVKSITILHGGQVDVRSAGPGKGSEFVVRLPRAPSWARNVSAEPAPRDGIEPARRAPLRILVVDDNVDAADSLAETLHELGHETAVAYDGPEGLVKARALDPEVALLDIGLPVMDGYELARSLKKEHGDQMTLVAVTGYGQPADRARAKEAGFHHHFVKPIHLAGLLALLQRVGPGVQPTA